MHMADILHNYVITELLDFEAQFYISLFLRFTSERGISITHEYISTLSGLNSVAID